MTTREWALVTAVVGVGVLAQIPGHVTYSEGHHGDAAHHDGSPAMGAEASPGARTVRLHVTGMT